MHARLSLDLRHQFDLWCLVNGLYDPLHTWMTMDQAKSVCETMHFDGKFFPLPIILRITEEQKKAIEFADTLYLCDGTQVILAKMDTFEIFPWSIDYEAQTSLQTTEKHHPFYEWLQEQSYTHAVSGVMTIVNHHLPFGGNVWRDLYSFPEQVKKDIAEKGWKTVVAFQTRNPLHRSHMALIQHAVAQTNPDDPPETKGALLHPVIGPTQETDIDAHTRVRIYKMILPHFQSIEPKTTVLLRLLPIHMRMAGPREACFHALIRKNVGATHFIVGRDHAGPSVRKQNGDTFYGPFDAQQLATKHQQEIGIQIIAMDEMVYDMEEGRYDSAQKVEEKGHTCGRISGTQLRRSIVEGTQLPEWFSVPEVIQELQRVEKIKNHYRGICIYSFGHSGSGKTTFTNELIHVLRSLGFQKPISILDGDEIRSTWSPDLGFTPADRNTEVRRIGRIASTVVEHGGIVLVANIAPFEEDRMWNKHLIEKKGTYIDIHFDTGAEDCVKRDAKGFYAEKGVKSMQMFETPVHTPVYTVHNFEEVPELLNNVVETIKKQFPCEFL